MGYKGSDLSFSLFLCTAYLWELRVSRGRGRQAAVRVGQVAGVQGTLRVFAVILPAVAAHVQVAVRVGNALCAPRGL